jgi:hypothetical protein
MTRGTLIMSLLSLKLKKRLRPKRNTRNSGILYIKPGTESRNEKRFGSTPSGSATSIEADIVQDKLRVTISPCRFPSNPRLSMSQFPDGSEQSVATPPAKSISSATSEAVMTPSPRLPTVCANGRRGPARRDRDCLPQILMRVRDRPILRLWSGASPG